MQDLIVTALTAGIASGVGGAIGGWIVWRAKRQPKFLKLVHADDRKSAKNATRGISINFDHIISVEGGFERVPGGGVDLPQHHPRDGPRADTDHGREGVRSIRGSQLPPAKLLDLARIDMGAYGDLFGSVIGL